MQITASNWMHLQIFLRKRGYPSATGSKGCGTRLKATGIAFWEMLYSISSELITNGFNLHSSWEKADAEQCWSEFQRAHLEPWPVLQSHHCNLGQSLCSFKVAQEKLFATCFKVLSQGSLHRDETELHSGKALVLRKQTSTPAVIATWAAQTKGYWQKLQ